MDWGQTPPPVDQIYARAANPRECKIRIWEEVLGSESNPIPSNRKRISQLHFWQFF